MNARTRGTLVVFGALVLVALLSPAQAEAQVGYSFYAVTPCRVLETGNTNPFMNQGGRVPSSVVWNISVKGRCNIPMSAVAVSLNLTVAYPTSEGYITLWPRGGTYPVVSTINFLAGEPAIANGAIVPVAAVNPDLSIAYGTPTANHFTHMAIDVTGYFQ